MIVINLINKRALPSCQYLLLQWIGHLDKFCRWGQDFEATSPRDSRVAGFHKPGPGALIHHQAVLYVILVTQKIHTDMVSNLPHIERFLISDPTHRNSTPRCLQNSAQLLQSSPQSFGTYPTCCASIIWNGSVSTSCTVIAVITEWVTFHAHRLDVYNLTMARFHPWSALMVCRTTHMFTSIHILVLTENETSNHDESG